MGRVYESGSEKGQPKKAFHGTQLGQTFTNGVARVDEEATWPCINPDTLQPKYERTWHVLVQQFGYEDITPDDQPPAYPLPPPKPYRAAQETARAEAERRASFGQRGAEARWANRTG